MSQLLFEDMDMMYNKYNANIAARALKPATHTMQDLIDYFTNQYPNIVRAPKQAPAPVINNDTHILDVYNTLVTYREQVKASLENPTVRNNKKIKLLGKKIVDRLDKAIDCIKTVDKLARHYKI